MAWYRVAGNIKVAVLNYRYVVEVEDSGDPEKDQQKAENIANNAFWSDKRPIPALDETELEMVRFSSYIEPDAEFDVSTLDDKVSKSLVIVIPKQVDSPEDTD